MVLEHQFIDNCSQENAFLWDIRSLRALYGVDKWEYLEEFYWKACLIISSSGLLFVSLCYHILLTPSHQPGLKNVPFIWIPLVRYLFRLRTLSDALTNIYVMNYIHGFCKLYEKEKIACITIFNRTVVFFFKPETAEVVLGSSKFVKKGYEYKVFNALLREGLFTSAGEKWQTRRKLLTQTFHFKILQDFLPVLQEKSETLVSKLNSYLGEPYIEVDTIMHSCSMDVILETAMGIKFDADDEEIIACIDAVKKGVSYSVSRIVRPWLLSDILFYFNPLKKKTEKNHKIIRDFMQKVLRQKKDINKHLSAKIDTRNGFTKKKKHKAFLDLLLELHMEDKTFTEEDILEEVLTFFIAGFDTTGSALSYTLYCIGLYEDVQRNIHEELDTIFGQADRDVTQSDLKAMKYLECTIKETLRLYPSVPYFSRCASKTFKILDCVIPKGSSLVIFPHVVHRDPDVYPDPEKFMPERFFPENCAQRHPFAYLPFSAGPRNCIGQKFGLMEVKTILANILRRFSVKSLDERDKILGISSIGDKSSEPLRMQFLPRV